MGQAAEHVLRVQQAPNSHQPRTGWLPRLQNLRSPEHPRGQTNRLSKASLRQSHEHADAGGFIAG